VAENSGKAEQSVVRLVCFIVLRFEEPGAIRNEGVFSCFSARRAGGLQLVMF
jgi:hypothetical protein